MTFGVLDLFPMTVLWSQSKLVPLMSTAGIVWGTDVVGVMGRL